MPGHLTRRRPLADLQGRPTPVAIVATSLVGAAAFVAGFLLWPGEAPKAPVPADRIVADAPEGEAAGKLFSTSPALPRAATIPALRRRASREQRRGGARRRQVRSVPVATPAPTAAPTPAPVTVAPRPAAPAPPPPAPAPAPAAPKPSPSESFDSTG